MTNVFVTARGEVTIRPAKPEDAARVRCLRLEALADLPQAFSADIKLTAVETEANWAERIAGYAVNDQSILALAQVGEQLVGMVGLGRGNRPKTRHSGTIWGVYVQPSWRGLRIGDALIAECLSWAREHSVVVAKLGVITPNIAAIRCYARCGFTVYGVEPKAIYYDGVYYDELLMAKAI
jgi:ribosomal protein S18 acetylase RimI-like enzyme